jgi:phosphohistidine phosphatase
MDLFVIRHAEAADATPDQTDAERPLTPRGAARFERTVEHLGRLRIELDALLHSPALRALETAERLFPVLKGDSAVSANLAAPPGEALLAEIAELDCKRVALVGHEPWLSQLAAWLTADDPREATIFELKKGAVLWLVGDPHPGAMRVRALLPPGGVS